ncbi:hypothetical protein LPMP_010250 [Leishmania panamensis]|uniref:Right handed beta helix domain-containing protein n=1 Tax=Leishmania panamensis TaxID=5679 RepID=A0A088S0W8_LEIPA|nr:hypothetical protein LPMP_010250 [Leishmania panamensis]AIN95126.1 hypothetical protein LPMP_010250 [Leishmania panamensis]
MDVREELVQLYRTYNPRRLKDIDAILEQFKGRERAMVTALREKYTRGGASADSSFTGASAAPLAEVPSRQTVTREVAAAPPPPTAAAAVGEAPLSAPVPPPPSSTAAHLSFADRSTGEAALSTFIPSPCAGSAAIGPATATAAGTAPAERHREMARLIDQMCSVDVERLAGRVAMLSASAPSPSLRTPRLRWRTQSREALVLQVDGEGNAGRYSSSSSSNRELTELLRHTAVFLNFFSQCARRFLLLAEEEWGRLAGSALTASDGAASSWVPPRMEARRTAVEVPQRSPHQGHLSTRGSKDNAEPMRSGVDGPPHDNGNHERDRWCGSSSSNNGGNDENAAPGIGTHPLSSTRARIQPNAAIVSPPEHYAGAPPTPSAVAAPVHSCDVNQAHATVSSSRRRSSCVRGIRQPSLFSSSASPPRASTGSPPLPATERGGDRVAGSSSPTYRTTTVSPLTSSTSRRSGHSPRTPSPPSPPRHSGGEATSGASAAAVTVRTHADQHSPSLPLDDSPAATPPRPLDSPPTHGGALILRPPPALTPLARRRVHTWTPSSQLNRYAAACAALQSGDCVVLQPGVYYEELVLDNCGHVELASAYPGAAVVLRPSSKLAPALRIRGARSQVELKGVVLVQGEGIEAKDTQMVAAASAALSSTFSTAPALPLLSVSDGAVLQATACHFYGGAGGGVIIAGPHTHATLDLCLISLCSFAGIYVHNGASVEVRQSKVKKSEAGLRALEASFYVSESTLEENKTDGIVVYKGSMGVLEGSSLLNNGGNGLFLEGGSGEEVRVIGSTIELNAFYGVQRSRSSTLHIQSSYIRDNGLLPISEEGG